MIHRVKARNGSKQVKNDTTTAASIKITCLRYFMKLLRLPCACISVVFTIRCFAMTEYNTIKMSNGMMKNTDMLPTKKKDGQKVSTVVWHTGTLNVETIKVICPRSRIQKKMKWGKTYFTAIVIFLDSVAGNFQNRTANKKKGEIEMFSGRNR